VLHADAVLTPSQHLRLARPNVEKKWPTARAAEFFGVGWRPPQQWFDRYRTVTATAVLRRAVAWFAARGVTARRVLTAGGRAAAPRPERGQAFWGGPRRTLRSQPTRREIGRAEDPELLLDV
jgi:hypothetical protein